MTDYEYGQKVMGAAGVTPIECCGKCDWCQEHAISYPDPYEPDGFCTLWDALEAKGWRVEFRTLINGTLCQVYKSDERGMVDLASIFQGAGEKRNAALVDAAGLALGVSRG